jgi:hypothetical protein
VPCRVVLVSRNIITILHKCIHKSASRSSVIACDPPITVFLNTEDCDLETDRIETDRIVSTSGEPSDVLTSHSPTHTEDEYFEPIASGQINVPTGPEMSSMDYQIEDTGSVPCDDASSNQLSTRVLRSASAAAAAQSTNFIYNSFTNQGIITFTATHFATKMPFTKSNKLASSEEMSYAYLIGKRTGLTQTLLTWLKYPKYLMMPI